MAQLTVSELAAQAEVSADTVRYYDRLGLLSAGRSEAGYRLYEPQAAERLRFIRGAQSLGLRLREVRDLLDVMDRGQCPCGHTKELVGQRLREIDAEITRLRAVKTELKSLLDRAEGCVDPTSWWCVAEFTERG